MNKTQRSSGGVGLFVALSITLLGCSAIFDGQEYLDADAAASDASEAGADTAPPDPCAGACSGERSVCDAMSGDCVQCLGDGDCTGDRGVCDAKACVQCSATNASACGGDTPLCDARADGLANTCVACNVSADCPASAPVCSDDHTCTLCLGNDACIACVECTADGDCAGASCKPDQTCSAFGDRTQRACEPCDDDANCVPMHRCVPMTFDDPAVDHGSFCLKLASAGCARPYFISPSTASISLGGSAGPYCGIDEGAVTCEAVRGLVDDTPCPSGDECGLGGLCRTVSGQPMRCTYECALASRCPDTVTCGAGTTAGVSYCGG